MLNCIFITNFSRIKKCIDWLMDSEEGRGGGGRGGERQREKVQKFYSFKKSKWRKSAKKAMFIACNNI